MQHGGRKPTETSVTEFCYKNVNLLLEELIDIKVILFLTLYLNCLDTQEKITDFPFLDILGYLKNTHKNPKFGRVRQVPIRELVWEFPGWDLSHFAKFGIFMGIF